MVASYSSDLRLTKQGDNDNPNSWGQVVNEQVIELLEEAIAGVTQINITGSSNVNISSTVNNGASDDARHAVLELTGTLGANIDLIVPSVEKIYAIRCAYSGAFTVTVKPSGGATGIVLNNTSTKILYTNGTFIHPLTIDTDISGLMVKTANLSDVADVPTARTNLGVDYVTILQQVYPIGSLYFNGSVNNNPSTLLGFGTWEAFAPGRVLIGVGSGTDINSYVQAFTLGQTGGEYRHTQTLSEMFAHSHDLGFTTALVGSGSAADVGRNTGEVFSEEFHTSTKGESQPMPWMQPYLAIHIWRRIA